MDQLMDILTEVNADVDFETCDTLIDDGILDSFDIVSIVGELNDTFDIEITPVDIVPENFNSAEAMWERRTKTHGILRYFQHRRERHRRVDGRLRRREAAQARLPPL